jgi:hypothetical protein
MANEEKSPAKPAPAQLQETITKFILAEYQITADDRAREIERGQSYVNLFLTIASGTAALLALMSQIDFTSFKFVSIPILLILFLLGIISYIRIVQRDIRITTHGRHMGRIRHYFVEIQPKIQPYLPKPPYDDKSYIPEGIDIISLKSIVSLINSSVVATMIFMATYIVAQVWVRIVIASIIFVGSLAVHQIFANARYGKAQRETKIRFPSMNKPDKKTR